MKYHFMKDDTFTWCGANLFNMEVVPLDSNSKVHSCEELCAACCKGVVDAKEKVPLESCPNQDFYVFVTRKKKEKKAKEKSLRILTFGRFGYVFEIYRKGNKFTAITCVNGKRFVGRASTYHTDVCDPAFGIELAVSRCFTNLFA